jgi:hypothetical protein
MNTRPGSSVPQFGKLRGISWQLVLQKNEKPAEGAARSGRFVNRPYEIVLIVSKKAGFS